MNTIGIMIDCTNLLFHWEKAGILIWNSVGDVGLKQQQLLAEAIALQQKQPLSYEQARRQVVQHNGLLNFDVDYATKPSAPPKNDWLSNGQGQKTIGLKMLKTQ